VIRLRQFRRLISVCLLAIQIVLAQLAAPLSAQKPAQLPAGAVQELSQQLAAIEKSIDQKRQELGIPGASLVIVKDDKIIYMKGLGVKDFEHNLPVTPDTLFAIGSASKAFTAATAVMTADDGKLSLDDSPKKFLPYFQLRDKDADQKITVRDLLSHRSGLNRTDLAMITNALNREELIRVAGMAKPTAKLGEKFQYQNVMYAAAGEIVAKAQKSTWDNVIATRIFKPLAMKASDTTVAAMQKSRDFSFGYDYNANTKETRRLPQREIAAAAPAGAINSNARDMAKWLRFMLGGGVLKGKRLISEKGFNELVTKQINVVGNIDYGFGWFLRQWNDHKVVEHGGNIDGFNSQVALMPDQKLGFVLLTNVTASTLGSFAMSTIWKTLVGTPTIPAVKASEKEIAGSAVSLNDLIGSYGKESPAQVIEIGLKDGMVSLIVAGQPPYALIEKEKNKLRSPGLPETYWIDVNRDATGKVSAIVLNQPEGRFSFRRLPSVGLIGADDLIAKVITAYGGEGALRKHHSSVTTVELDMENQGVQAHGLISAQAPNLAASKITLTALDKKIGSLVTYFDGTSGGEVLSFAPEEVYTGKRLEDMRVGADFYELLDWKKNFKSITVQRITKIGDEDAYVVEKRSEKGTAITEYISTKSFLILRRDTIIASETSGLELPQTVTFSDYRSVGGVMIPFKAVSSIITNGETITLVKDIKFDVEIPDSVFHKPSAVRR
jgi:CubicO group peptidase (beta-lactamase class C family)